MHGYPFTWERGRGKANWVEERLDRAVTSNSWRLLFKNVKLENIITVCSDHSAIYLDMNFKHGTYKERPFRFENAWLRDEECSNIMDNYWQDVEDMSFPKQVAECCQKIKHWGDRKFKHFGRAMDEIRSTL